MKLAAVVLTMVCALAVPGCCSLLCPPKQYAPIRITRDTPEKAIQFLIEAFRAKQASAIYDSLHPAYVKENGDFSLQEFNVAYQRLEPDFLADAESLASAHHSPVRWRDTAEGQYAGMTLSNEATGTRVDVWFQNQPKLVLVTKDPLVPEITGEFDARRVVKLADGRLSIDFDLTSIPGVAPEAVGSLAGKDVTRFEVHDDWLIRLIPEESAKNVQFLNKLKREYMHP